MAFKRKSPAHDHETPDKITPDGNDIIDEMTKFPTLDSIFDSDPDRLTDEQLRSYIDMERRNRGSIGDE